MDADTGATAGMRTGHRGTGWARRAVLGALLLGAGGCSATHWDAEGSWSGTLTVPGSEPAFREGGMTDLMSGPTTSRVRLCDLHAASVSLPFASVQAGNPAAIEIRSLEALCRTGVRPIDSGVVRVWTHPSGDPNTLAALPSDGWSVDGTIDVTGYTDLGLPDLDTGESATVERMSGTFELTAHSTSGDTVRIMGGTFSLSVRARRFKRTIS